MNTDSSTSGMTQETEYLRMKSSILDTIEVRDRKRTRKHRAAVFGIAGVLVLGTTAGALAVAAAPQGQINYTADCYRAADMSAQHGTSVYLPGDESDKAATPLAERVALATQMCAATWSVGTFAPAGSTAPFTVPTLVACQLPDERLAIFPATASQDSTCSALGLSTPHD